MDAQKAGSGSALDRMRALRSALARSGGGGPGGGGPGGTAAGAAGAAGGSTTPARAARRGRGAGGGAVAVNVVREVRAPVAPVEDDGVADAPEPVRRCMSRLAETGLHLGPSDRKLLVGILTDAKAVFDASTISAEGIEQLTVTLTPATMAVAKSDSPDTPLHTLQAGPGLKINETATPYMMQVFASELEDPLYLTCQKRALLVAANKGLVMLPLVS